MRIVFLVCFIWVAWGDSLDLLEQTCCSTVKHEGMISDCSCDYAEVNEAARGYFVPLLANLTSRTYFRYFRVNLERPCPFWDEDGSCMLEGCSVGVCANEEVPMSWLMQGSEMNTAATSVGAENGDVGGDENANYSPSQSVFHPQYPYHAQSVDGADVTLGLISRSSLSGDATLRHLDSQVALDEETYEDDLDEWTDMSECKDVSSPFDLEDDSVYVNLLANPEGYTGYTGPPARRVWQAIQNENCFSSTGDEGDLCTEKRIFYRLMSGLHASISTHIAKEYYFDRGWGEGSWGHNIPHFVNAVGAHPNRLTNLYFSWLFLLRAVVRGCPALIGHPFHTGDPADDEIVRELIAELCADPVTSSRVPSNEMGVTDTASAVGTTGETLPLNAVAAQCRVGFDESMLFTEGGAASTDRWDAPAASTVAPAQLREEFRNRFRNISRIMDCVTCERCRVWGKVQILGLGTGIKLLLTPQESLQPGFLRRQEVIAIINTLHQFSQSIEFAAKASRLELEHRLSLGFGLGFPAVQLIYLYCVLAIAMIFASIYFLLTYSRRASKV